MFNNCTAKVVNFYRWAVNNDNTCSCSQYNIHSCTCLGLISPNVHEIWMLFWNFVYKPLLLPLATCIDSWEERRTDRESAGRRRSRSNTRPGEQYCHCHEKVLVNSVMESKRWRTHGRKYSQAQMISNLSGDCQPQHPTVVVVGQTIWLGVGKKFG